MRPHQFVEYSFVYPSYHWHRHKSKPLSAIQFGRALLSNAIDVVANKGPETLSFVCSPSGSVSIDTPALVAITAVNSLTESHRVSNRLPRSHM